MTDVTIFNGTTGLNTADDPVRLKFNEDTGVREMAKALNVVVEPSGRVSRRDGFVSKTAGEFHSFWCEGGQALVVKDDYLCLLHNDLTTSNLIAVTNGLRVAYAEDESGQIFWSNTRELGYVYKQENREWTPGTSPRAEDDRYYAPSVPKGHMLEIVSGRMYNAQGDTVWVSERYLYSLYWLKGQHLHFSGRISLLAGVDGGIWISDPRGIYWIAGYNPQGQNLIKKASYPAVEGTALKVDSDRLRVPKLEGAGEVVLFVAREGLCVAGPDGFFMNLTEGVLEADKSPRPFRALFGAAAEIKKRAIFTLEP